MRNTLLQSLVSLFFAVFFSLRNLLSILAVHRLHEYMPLTSLVYIIYSHHIESVHKVSRPGMGTPVWTLEADLWHPKEARLRATCTIVPSKKKNMKCTRSKNEKKRKALL